jgi:hypothetical protein
MVKDISTPIIMRMAGRKDSSIFRTNLRAAGFIILLIEVMRGSLRGTGRRFAEIKGIKIKKTDK